MDQDAPDLSITPVPPRVDLPSHDEYFSRNNLRLHEISTLLIQDRDVASLYDRILNAAIDLMSSDMASMQVFHPGRNRLELAVWKGFHPASAAHWKWVSLDSSCSCGVALKAGCRIVVPDTETCEFMAGTAELDEYRRSGIRAVQSTPLMSRTGELLGMISTHWRTPHRPTEYALRTLDVVARQVADLIERTKIENELRKTSERFRWLASIVESSDDAIIGSNLEGAITSWNKGA